MSNQTRGRKYLFDASAFTRFLLYGPEQKVSSLIHTIAVLDSDLIDIGQEAFDTIQNTELKRIERSRFLDAFAQSLLLAANLKILPFYLKEVCNLAAKESISLKDACLVHAARRYRLRLVTESEKLERVASAYCRVTQLDALLVVRADIDQNHATEDSGTQKKNVLKDSVHGH